MNTLTFSLISLVVGLISLILLGYLIVRDDTQPKTPKNWEGNDDDTE